MVKRIYVEKKKAYAVAEKELLENINVYLGIKGVSAVKVCIRYDVENIDDPTWETAKLTVFSEPPVDDLFTEVPCTEGDRVFSVEYLPGQFDQRADSAVQCVQLLNDNSAPIIKTATTYVISGNISDEDFTRIQEYCINPVDSRITGEEVPETLNVVYDEPADVIIFDGFMNMADDKLKELYDSLSLAMTFKDFKFIQAYYRDDEKRDPSMTEIRVLDTYWSDHCRHTTFLTELKDVAFNEGFYKKPIQDTYNMYLEHRKDVYAGKKEKPVSLMDIALMGMKKLRKDGKLQDMEDTDEINACSIIVPVEIDGVTEEWLVSFKNETHNHPTEIEPFGGAATCLGGAIRDPLSGRSYVYQAMRVTGAADPTKALSETLKGKLPQRKIVTEAAHGYSSYGNQIGLATGIVSEIYHPGYVAKRMEIGAVIGAAPRKNVVRETSDPGDIIILLGGRTGRDGCGGATGSSKAHDVSSIDTCGAEVQKGNAPTERKLQRLFRNPDVSTLIKKCNDFGAGGVSVAIGELAAGLQIDLDKVLKKYAGLDGTELAISESQERMAVVIDPKDVEKFIEYAKAENLEAECVATVTEDPRLVMKWRGKEIVNLSRAFLDTNGAHQETGVEVQIPSEAENYFRAEVKVDDVKDAWLNNLSDLNVCSQKGLVEMFDSSIGAGTVAMPYGGKYQLTPAQTMIGKLPLLKGKTNTITMMSYGFNPYLSSWSPYHGASFAVVESVAKIVAAGGDYKKIRFTFQEYFKRMTEDKTRWSEPMTALLGAYNAQVAFGLPSIGGKDSMSGTFDNINVPPTLVSFAVDTGDSANVVTTELKEAGDAIVRFEAPRNEYDIPDYEAIKAVYEKFHELVKAGKIKAAFVPGIGGLAGAISKMAFGNKIGVKVSDKVAAEDLFKVTHGDIIAEMSKEDAEGLDVIAETTAESAFQYKDAVITMDEALNAWTKTLEKVFPTKSGNVAEVTHKEIYTGGQILVCKNKIAKPRVFIPAFPGTNCEYDSKKAFEKAGAEVEVIVFKNTRPGDISDTVEAFVKAINKAQIIMFPGGFSAGDEPDGSGKFISNAFRNEHLREAVMDLLNKRDGLALGICNGFQALIKLGLVPYGEIRPQTEDSPTLTTNCIGRHASTMVYTKVVTNKSPWLSGVNVGDVFSIPASHGEGRFVANEAWIKKLFETGCVATQYVDPEGNPTMDEAFNPNGSFEAIEGIISPDGRVLGKMAHSERIGESVAVNITGNHDQHIFESGVKYFS